MNLSVEGHNKMSKEQKGREMKIGNNESNLFRISCSFFSRPNTHILSQNNFIFLCKIYLFKFIVVVEFAVPLSDKTTLAEI